MPTDWNSAATGDRADTDDAVDDETGVQVVDKRLRDDEAACCGGAVERRHPQQEPQVDDGKDVSAKIRNPLDPVGYIGQIRDVRG